MNAKRRATVGSRGAVLFAALVLAPDLAAAAPGRSEAPPVIRWAVRAEAPVPAEVSHVECTRVGYVVDVYGGTATGTLTYVFSYGGEDAVTARFESTLPPAVEVLGLALESQGRLDDLAIEPAVVASDTRGPTPDRSLARPARNGARADAPAVSSVRSASFEIPEGTTFEVRTRFRFPLSVERGNFGLTLPPVEKEPAPGSRRPEAPRTVLSGVSVSVHHDAPLLGAASSTHEILVDFLGDRTVIEPVVREFPASLAFGLTFATSSAKEPTLAGHVRRDGETGHAIEILLDPPREPEKTASRAKQVLFVVDSSGSMAVQDKLDQARRAVGRSLESLQPADRFNIIEFDDDFKLLRPAPIEPVAAGDPSVERWLAGLTAEGGTRLLPALAAALDQPDDPERHHIIVVVTDGILADEAPVLELLKERLGERRLFVVGMGPVSRQETLLRLAEYGRGAAAFFGESGSLEQTVGDLFASIADPLAWDLRLDWDGGDVAEIEPSRLPDLYAGRPVRVLARVRGDLPFSLAVTVSTVDGERRYRVSLPPMQ
jgi:hypothetical protein